MTSRQPSELILARCRAFACGDFRFIYETYHPQARFRQLFPDRDEYIRYGSSELRRDFRIRECRILRQETAGDRSRVIWYLDMMHQGEQSRTLELSILCRVGEDWRYFGGRKMDREAFHGEMEEVDWEDFGKDEDLLL